MNFVEQIATYYQTEANHGLVTSLTTGAVMIIAALLLWFMSAHWSIQKGVAIVLVLCGLIFFVGGALAGKMAKNNLPQKVELYQADRQAFLTEEVEKVEKIHKQWLPIKLFWAVLIVAGIAIILASAKPFLTGVAIGLLIAGTIGLIEETISFQHNKRYRMQVLENSKAQDWAQWRGPLRDGVVKANRINLDWSDKKPSLLWVFRQAGSGYSSPSIVGTTLYCQGAADGSDFAFALDTRTGNLKWKQNLGAEYIQDDERGNGPRGSITVDGDKLYLIRGGGQIHCLSADEGTMLWQKDFRTDFGGRLYRNWGYSESPIVDGNHVICTPGGSQGTMMALDKNTGALVWRSEEWTDDAVYSSPIVAEVNGIRQYIQTASNGVAGVSAKDGKLLWEAPIYRGQPPVIPTPIYHNNMVYVTAGTNLGCNLIRLTLAGDAFNPEIVYFNKNMVNHHGGVVLLNGHIYGFTDGMGFVCQNFENGETVWRERNVDILKGSVIAVNDRLLLLNERNGLITVIAASPEGWKEFGRMEIPERTKISTSENMVWTHQVIANGKLYIRDHDLLFCFEL